jgi:flavin-dependent dehydrogenase
MQTADRSRHDVVVVGARVAGSATAMLLARLGHDVVVLDQASFPSDTVSPIRSPVAASSSCTAGVS